MQRPRSKEVTQDGTFNHGHLYVELIKLAKKTSNRDINSMQFNFCIDGLSSSKEEVMKCLKVYFDVNQSELAKFLQEVGIGRLEDLSELLPVDARKIHEYHTALTLRSDSFFEAAKLICSNSDADENNKAAAMRNLELLNKKYHAESRDYHDEFTKETACYDAYIAAIIDILKQENILADGSQPLQIDEKIDEKIKEQLANAETIISMRAPRKVQMTLTGSTADGSAKVVALQVDEPLTRFSDLSKEQQDEWLKITGPKETHPEWFKSMPTWEQQNWRAMMIQIKMRVVQPENSYITPVVKKLYIPGLRNCALSSDYLIDCSGQPAMIMRTNKTVRSSNLLVVHSEKTGDLSAVERQLTKMNIRQVKDIYDHLQSTASVWGDGLAEFTPVTLYQTLLRPKGGGDDFVVKLKNSVIDEMNLDAVSLDGMMDDSANTNKSLLYSNHCIGYGTNKATGMLLSVAFEDFYKVNTVTFHHIDAAFNNFNTNVVLKVEKANGSLSHDQEEHFNKIKSAVNDYKIISEKASSVSSYPHAVDQNYQLHLAVLEEIIYQETYNRIQSSCKSGKDREGILKCYRNAMHHFHAKYRRFPGYAAESENRKEFVEEFIRLFVSHHQQRLAENNAVGCQGLKALKNILPKDIYDLLKSNEWFIHNEMNAELNELSGKHAKKEKEGDDYGNTYNISKQKFATQHSPSVGNRARSKAAPLPASEAAAASGAHVPASSHTDANPMFAKVTTPNALPATRARAQAITNHPPASTGKKQST